MARIGNYPTTFEERKNISITDLRKWKYLEPNTWKTGTLTWSRNGNPNGCIGIIVVINDKEAYLTLSYTVNKEKAINYQVPLIKAASNLGKGYVWYFHCPFTNKLCRKLYQYNDYFLHRSAINGYYEKQIQSKKYRDLEKVYGPAFRVDKLYEELYSRHFRMFYKGKPTKRYLKIMVQLKAAEGVSEKDFINAMCKRK
ncbi:hypothetical protein [Chitinophaga defluvii]|uniref:LAGLIDADG DNA endonuclease family protein n=1 Tax=Chitinophaga defluvii TaxID=3163343 RepID=A0ABV2T8Z9_9BACT